MKARFVVCANGTLVEAEARRDRRDHGLPSATPSTRRDGTTTGPATISQHLADKRVAIIGTGATAVQAIPDLGKQRRSSSTSSRGRRVRSTCGTTGRPIPNGRRRSSPDGKRTRREQGDRGPAAHRGSRRQSAALRFLARRERSVAKRTRTSTYMMRIHKRIDQETVEDPATAEALKPWYMFMCKRPVLPQRVPADVQIGRTSASWTRRGRASRRSREAGPEFDRRDLRRRPDHLRDGLRGPEDGDLQPDRRSRRDALELDAKYEDGIRTVLGIHSRGYPNFFIMGGYQASSSRSI